MKTPAIVGDNLLRVALGIMFIAHSVVLKYFTFTLAGTAQYFASIGLPASLAYVVFAELPVPDVNRTIELAGGDAVAPDPWFEDYGLAVEYEGGHHQDDRGQYLADIDRYAAYRRSDVPYEQVTKERLRSPRATVRLVHRALVDRGYDGPPPNFEGGWLLLFMLLSDLVRRARAA